MLPEWAGTKIYGCHLAYVHMLCHLSYKQQDICLDKCPITFLKCIEQKRIIHYARMSNGICQKGIMEYAEKDNGMGKNVQPIPDNKPNNKPDKLITVSNDTVCWTYVRQTSWLW